MDTHNLFVLMASTQSSHIFNHLVLTFALFTFISLSVSLQDQNNNIYIKFFRQTLLNAQGGLVFKNHSKT